MHIQGHTFMQDFHVITFLHQHFILGMDFLRDNKATIDIGNNQLTLQQGKVQLVFTKLSGQTSLGSTQHTVTVPPMSEIVIPVKLSRPHHGTTLFTEPLQSLATVYNLTAAK